MNLAMKKSHLYPFNRNKLFHYGGQKQWESTELSQCNEVASLPHHIPIVTSGKNHFYKMNGVVGMVEW